MTQNERYAALRATIRERGTARMVVLPFIFIGWAATAVATAAVITVAVSTLVPLLILVAGFEAVFALHVNVERIGRYLQVFHEKDDGWEHVAMRFGQQFPGSGPDPLFSRHFLLATSVNFLPAALGGAVPELIIIWHPARNFHQPHPHGSGLCGQPARAGPGTLRGASPANSRRRLRRLPR